MRELTGKPESWTTREQAAVVLNALYFAREALWNCKGSDAGDVLNDPLGGMCPPTIWFDDDGCPVATPINEAFCRPIQDRLAILRSPMFARWLESRGASNAREFLQRIQTELEKSDRLFDVAGESGQVDEGYEETLFQQRAQRDQWPDWFRNQYREELAKFNPGTDELRKAGWLRGPVPEQQLLDQIRELALLSLQLETFVAGDDAAESPGNAEAMNAKARKRDVITKAVAKLGIDQPVKKVLTEASINESDGRQILRELEAEGLYRGFARRPSS